MRCRAELGSLRQAVRRRVAERLAELTAACVGCRGEVVVEPTVGTPPGGDPPPGATPPPEIPDGADFKHLKRNECDKKNECDRMGRMEGV